MTYTVTYGHLQVTALTPEFREKTCGYWYTITSGANAHAAFATKAGLMRWLAERGLTLAGELPETQGEFATTPVIGEYRTASHGQFSPSEDNPYRMTADDEFCTVRPLVISAALSNGDYTLALIDETDGVRTVHTLNPNVRDRIVADHAAMHRLLN